MSNLFICVLISLCSFAASGSSLIGGRLVEPDEFSEVIRIRSGNSYCTASIIGPRVILTAAHCSHDNGEIVPVSESDLYEFVLEQTVYKARCTIAPEYSGRTGDQDMSLCLTDKPVDVKFGIVLKTGPKIDEVITLMGYGCTKIGGGDYDGKLRTGEALVTKLPTPDYYSIHTIGNSALCFGDSGGPAFKRIDNPRNEYHYIYSVNSRGNIKDLSLLTAVFHPKSIEFMEKFEREKGVEICGISKDCENPKGPYCKEELNLVKSAVKELSQCLL